MEDVLTFDTGLTLDEYKPKGVVLDVVGEDNSILETLSQNFDFNEDGPKEAKDLSDNLIATAVRYKALGLAAIQCGIPKRVFVMGSEDDYMTIFNPRIISFSADKNMMAEGCVSFMGLVINIERPLEIVAEFQNEKGEVIKDTFTGLTARIFQHEFDHLNGVSFTKRAKPMALKKSLSKREKQFKLFAKQLAAQRKLFKNVK